MSGWWDGAESNSLERDGVIRICRAIIKTSTTIIRRIYVGNIQSWFFPILCSSQTLVSAILEAPNRPWPKSHPFHLVHVLTDCVSPNRNKPKQHPHLPASFSLPRGQRWPASRVVSRAGHDLFDEPRRSIIADILRIVNIGPHEASTGGLFLDPGVFHMVLETVQGVHGNRSFTRAEKSWLCWEGGWTVVTAIAAGSPSLLLLDSLPGFVFRLWETGSTDGSEVVGIEGVLDVFLNLVYFFQRFLKARPLPKSRSSNVVAGTRDVGKIVHDLDLEYFDAFLDVHMGLSISLLQLISPRASALIFIVRLDLFGTIA